jgi:hypothetical protein
MWILHLLTAATLHGLVLADAAAVRQDGPPGDRYGLAVPPAAPSRAAIFRLRSEQQFLDELGEEFRQRYPNEIFLRPVPADRFDRPDAPTLGASWFQNRRTGTRQDARGRRGDMGIEQGAGILPPHGLEAAVLNESPSGDEFVLGVDVLLGEAEGRFGVLFGAQDPDRSLEPVDQREWNTYGFVWSSNEEIVIGRSVGGNRTELARARVEPQRQFRLEVVVHDGRIRVTRDGEPVLEAALEQPLHGRFVGVIGQSNDAAIRFDNFAAEAYAGSLEPRTFAASVRSFPAPGVRYRPIYFEHVGIERYGHHLGNLIQPPLEHGAFFLDAAALPLRLPHEPPWECQSDVGYCRPGDVVWPFRLSFPDW